MEVVQLSMKPFVAVKREEKEGFAIAIGVNILTKNVYTNIEECEHAIANFNELFINLVCFLAHNVCKGDVKNE